MSRYRHFMAPTTTGELPKRIVVVDCVGEYTGKVSGDGVETESLVQWHAAYCDSKFGGIDKISWSQGQSAREFWLDMSAYCADKRPITIVSARCNRAWSLLGLWEMLESGAARCVGTDYRSDTREADIARSLALSSSDPLQSRHPATEIRERGKRDGYLVVEDPPNVAKIQCRNRPAWLTWLDIRNHGLDLPDTVPHGKAACAWMYDWIIGACKILSDHELGQLCATAGSQSLSIFKRRYYAGGIYCHTDADATRVESASYHGGRCEAYRIGAVERDIYHVDIRSAYAWVMRSNELPVRLVDYCQNQGQAEPQRKGEQSGVIARVLIRTDEPAYPYMRDKDVVYPVGRFWTTLAGPELSDAEEKGRVLAYGEYCTYETGYCCQRFANELHQLRLHFDQTYNGTMSAWIKRLICSLPGKFGQRSHTWEYCPKIEPECEYGEWVGADEYGEVRRYRSIANIVQVDRSEGYAYDSQLAIASAITSIGRMILLNYVRIAGWQHVYYVDTDALFVDIDGYQNLCRADCIDTMTLGKLQLKHVSTSTVIHGIKHYSLDGAVVCAGLPRGVVRKSPIPGRYDIEPAPGEAVKTGARPTAKRYTAALGAPQKYRHGVVSEDGTVKPHAIWEK